MTSFYILYLTKIKMQYIPVLNDSIATAVSLKLFKSVRDATDAHLHQSRLALLPLSTFASGQVDNFNPERLQSSAVKAYPPQDRPRGDKDIKSVRYYQKQFANNLCISPIWLVEKPRNNKYILLDGAHRVVAAYIEKRKSIHAYIVLLT
jgi:hypothetical protein